MDNLQSIAQCISNFPFQLPALAMHSLHGRRINAAQLDSPGCFQVIKLLSLSFYVIIF